MPLLPNQQREWAFDVVLVELERRDLAEPWRETLNRLHAAGVKSLPPNSPSLARLNALMVESPPKEVYELRPAPVSLNEDPVPQDIDYTDVAAIELAVLRSNGDAQPWRPIRVLEELGRRPKAPDERRAFLDAVCIADGITLADKLRALEEVVQKWVVYSLSLRDHLPKLGESLVAKHADELVGSSWEVDYSWRCLASTFGLAPAALVPRVVEALDNAAAEVDGDGWLALAGFYAPGAAPAVLGRGLERFLDRSGTAIPDEVGDGPWSEQFAVQDDAVDVTARFVWMRLGCYEAAERWRAAHAVRRFAACGRDDIINALVGLFETNTADPFSSPNLPFYFLHARLWLLIALARIAKDRPALVASHRGLLERVAFGDGLPHVAMRSFARDALEAGANNLSAEEASELCAKLALVNVSLFTPSQEDGQQIGHYVGRPAGQREPDKSFRPRL